MLRDRPSLHGDFETWGDRNLKIVGDAVYAETAFPLLLGLKLEAGSVDITDYANEFNNAIDDFGGIDFDYAPEPPELLVECVKDNWYFVAHNWSFEYQILLNMHKKFGWPLPRIEQFICTAAKARYWGLSGTLEVAGKMLDLSVQKNKEGSRLIQKFCVPQKTGRAKNAAKFIRKIDRDDPDWILFRDVYNHDDVETEYGVDMALPDIPDKYARFFYSDANMNARGFPVDVPSLDKAQTFYHYFHSRMEKRFKELSGGLAPSQVAKVKELLNDGHDEDLDNLQSATIRDRLLEDDLTPDAREMLEIRAETAKASIKKLGAFILRTAADWRAHGGFMFYGAHTGRRSGKGIQPQNFPRGTKAALKQLKAFWRLLDDWVAGLPDAEVLELADLLFAKPLDVLAAALRGFIKAQKGKKFVVVDYAQIELRVLAWLAGEEELLQLLRDGHDPYINFAAKYMYGVDPSTYNKESLERQIAKSALLGAQYQIWIDAFIAYAKTSAGLKLTLEEGTNAVVSYRTAHPNIVDFWKDIEKAAIFAVETRGTAVLNNLRLKFEIHDNREWLRIYLPSGRPISYFTPRVTERITEHEKKDFEGNPVLDKEGNPTYYTKKKRVLSFITEWKNHITREYTYGGKLTENVVQGTSADIMYEGEIIAEANGYPLIASVHDETVTEVDEDFGSVEELVELVCRLPDCYEGLPIAAEGFECIRYRK